MSAPPPSPTPDDPHGPPNASSSRAATGSLRPALLFGVVAATIEMALLLSLMYC